MYPDNADLVLGIVEVLKFSLFAEAIGKVSMPHPGILQLVASWTMWPRAGMARSAHGDPALRVNSW